MAAIFAGAQRLAFEIGVDLAGIARRRLERMVAEALRRVGHDGAGHALGQRRIGIFVLPRAFEHVAAVDDLAAQIAGLAGDAAQFFELVVIRFELVIGDRQVLDGHLGRNGVLAVALGDMAAQLVIGRQPAPSHAVPMRAGAAEIGAGQERAEAADRQRGLRRRMAQRHGFKLRVLKQFLPHRVFEIVAHRRNGEILARHALCAAFEADDVETGLGQFAGEDRSGPADPDDDRIGFLEL